MPRGVSMYFCVVTREMVDSCRPSMSAISRSTSGRIATSPCSKKCRCRSTIACATRRIVSKRCCTFLISHLRLLQLRGELLVRRCRGCACRMSAYIRLMRSFGIAAWLSDATQLAAHLAHDHVGHDVARLVLRERRARAADRGCGSARASRAARVVAVQHALQLGEVARGEQRRWPSTTSSAAARCGVVGRQRLQLQREALGEVARADAGGLEALQVLAARSSAPRARSSSSGEHARRAPRASREVAVVVERVDQRRDDLPVAQRQVEQRELARSGARAASTRRRPAAA